MSPLPRRPHLDWGVLEAAYHTPDWLLSVWCASRSPEGHARCSHPAYRRRTDGCLCPCHDRSPA